MAGEDLRIRAQIDILLKDSGAAIKKADKLLKEMDKDAAKAAKSLDRAEKSAGKLGSTLTRFLGAAVIARFVQQSITAFADWERQLSSTGSEARNLGLDVDDTVGRVKAMTAAIEEQTGILRQDTTPIFNKFLGLTGDVEQATILLNAAVGAQEKQYKDVATAANLLGGILQGEVIEPAKSLGLAFDQTKDSAEQQAEVLDQALDKFLDYGDAADDARGSLDSMAASTNKVRISVGEALAPAIGRLSDFFAGFIIVLQKAWAGIGTFVSAGIQGFTSLGRVITAAWDAIRTGGAGGTFTTLRETAEKELALIGDIFADGAAEQKRISGEAEKAVTLTVQQQLDARQKLRDAAAARSAKKAEERLAKELAKAAEEEAKKADFALKAKESQLRAELALTEEGSRERLAKELEILALLKERALKSAEEIKSGEAELNEAFRLAEQKLRADHNAQLIEDAAERNRVIAEAEFEATLGLLDALMDARDIAGQDTLELEIKSLKAQRDKELSEYEGTWIGKWKIAIKWAQIISNAEKDIAAGRLEFQKAADAAELDSKFALASASVQLGQAVFGESKAAAYAIAVINIARQITAHLGNWYQVAAIAAAGAVQLATISQTNIGSASAPSLGGSIPTQQSTSGPANGVVTEDQQQEGTTQAAGAPIIIQGPNIISDSSMRRFVRAADRARRQDQARRQR